MEDKKPLSDKILSILNDSSTNEAPLSEILGATNVPKKTLNAELQKLKRKGVIQKINDTPPVWSLKDPNKSISQETETRSRLTRSKVHVDKESDSGKTHLNKSIDEKIAESKSANLTMNQDLGKRIISYLQRQSRPAKTVDIAKAVGCKTAKEINPTLYAMKRKNFVVKVTESPPTWSVSTEIPPDFCQDQVRAGDFRPNVITQSQQNVAVPVQYPTDGTILPFQETSLFNSDVSFETDYSDLMTGDNNLNSTDGDPSLTVNQSVVTNDAFNIASDNPLNLNRGLFDEDPENEMVDGEPQNTERGFGGEDSLDDTSSQESSSDKMFEEQVEKPSAFRTFFKLDESLSEDSEEGDMKDSVNDSDNNVDETSGENDNSLKQSNDMPNEFLESNKMMELHGDYSEILKDFEQTEMVKTQLIDDPNNEAGVMDLGPPVLDKQEMIERDQYDEDKNNMEEDLERNSNEAGVVFPNELMEVPPIETEEIAPSALPDQLPLDQDSDSDDDAMDQANDHMNANVQENQCDTHEQINDLKEEDTKLNEMSDLERKGQSNFFSGDNQMNIIKRNEMQAKSQFSSESSMNKVHSRGIQETSRMEDDDDNKNNNANACDVSLSDDCQQLLNAFNPDTPCAQFVLKNKSKLSPDKLADCLQKLKEENLAEQNGSQWQLTEGGKIQHRSMFNKTAASSADQSTSLPRKRPHSSGPPPSPMALIQKEKGIPPEATKESPLGFLRGARKVDPFKHTVDVVHNRASASGDSGSQNNVEHLNSSLFPGARNVSSSYSSISASQLNRPTQSTVTQSLAGGHANTPVPLMSLNVDSRPASRTCHSNFSSQYSETNTFSDKSSASSLFQQESGQFFNQSSESSLFPQATVPSQNQSSSSMLRPSYEPANSLFKPPGSSIPASGRSSLSPLLSSSSRPTVTQASSPMGPPAAKPKAKPKSDRVVIPKPPPRPGAVSSGPSAMSQKPPMSPAEMLARGLKKTDITPATKMDSSTGSVLSSSRVQSNASQGSVVGNQSMLRPSAGPQSLMTGSLTGNQLSRGNLQTSANQSGMLSSNLTGSSQTDISSQTGITSQTGIRSLMSQQPGLGSLSGYKPQTLSQGQFGSSSSSAQSQGLGAQSGFKPLSQLQTSSSGQFGSLSGAQSQPTPTVRPAPQPRTTGQALSLDTESFAALNKNPVSALMEYAQSRKLEARVELIGRRGASHRPTFEMAAFVGKRQFPSVHCSNKKDAKTEACDIALRQLIAEGQFQQSAQTPKPTVAPSSMTHFDKMAALTHRGFTALVSQIRNESFAGRKVIAGMVMKRSENDTGILVSLGTGNRCITGQQLSLEGNTINDSHAEIITRRGFIRFLYKQLWEYTPQKPSPMFERSPRGKIQIKPNITFHLYISTAPCGDGALFSPRDEAANKAPVDMRIRPPHNPTFSSNVQGLLRTKVEGGEGTIPIEPGFKGLTFDGVQRGERLLTMSCTDKVCRWNVVGLQGALLSHFMEPVYLDSLTLGLLYDHGHLARAVCCRVGRSDTDIDSLLPPGYKLNHPWLGRVTVCDPPREVQKTKALSVNWCFGDNTPEVVDGTLGLNLTSIEKQMFSRCSKRNLYNSFKKLCEKFDRQDLLSAQTYREAKEMATDFKTAKEAMLKKFKENKYGKWVSKPVEEEMFS